MFELKEVRVLHLEPTTICQATCPQCSRTIYAGALRHAELTLANIQKILPLSFVTQLDKIFMCGNFGEPAAAKEAIEIFQWFREINPSIVLGMNTNGGVRNQAWWKRLAEVFKGPQDYVVFSIDGLADTNHIYRIGVNWDILTNNVRAFISAGGNAHWDMLVYKHNEHQIDECIALAKTMQFKWFRSKVTKRAIPLTSALELPTQILTNKIFVNAIICHALKEKSIYLSAAGIVYPCCWIGSNDLIQKTTTTLTDITNEFNSVVKTWATINPNRTCKTICSSSCTQTNFEYQWKNEIQLN